MVYPIKSNSRLIIKSFKGAKPEGAPDAYDARSVMKYIGPKLALSKARSRKIL